MITEIGKNIKFTGVDSNIGTTNQIKKNEKLSGTVLPFKQTLLKNKAILKNFQQALK